MKFEMKNFLELDVKGLLCVNGGANCSSSNSNGNHGGDPGKNTSPSGTPSGRSSGGTCGSGPSRPSYPSPISPKGGSSCSSTPTKAPEEYQPTPIINPISSGGTCNSTSGDPDGNSEGNDTENDAGGNGEENDGRNPVKSIERQNDDGTTTKITDYDDGSKSIDTYDTKTGEIIFSHDGTPYNGKTSKPDSKGTSTVDTGVSVTDTNSSGNHEQGTVTSAEQSSTGGDSNSGMSGVTTSGEQSGCGSSHSGSSGAGYGITSNTPGGIGIIPTEIDTFTPDNPGGGNPLPVDESNPTEITENNPEAGSDGNNQLTGKTHYSFGQITDGSYADNLTMQYYLKDFPWSNGELIDTFMYGTYSDKNGETQECKFSLVGCKEAGAAKIGSEILGENVSLMTIQNKCDLNKDGNLSAAEIATGLNDMLDEKYGDIYDINYEDILSGISKDKLIEISNKSDTYVLGFAENCHGGHWVVLEGFSQDSNGIITFNYDGTSVNDTVNNRTFVLGVQNESTSSESYSITRIQTFTKVPK